jgi:hypothetical protein
MTSKRTVDLSAPLVPHFFYRRGGAVALGVIGLADSSIDEKIRSGELPPLVKAFESGRTTGWFGWQLIELQRRRLAKAAAEVEPEPVEVEPTRKRAAAARRASGKLKTTAAEHTA